MSWRFLLQTPWGSGEQELSADVPRLENRIEESIKLGGLLWARFAARAATAGIVCLTWRTVCWRSSSMALPAFEPPLYGNALGLPAARSATPTLFLHSGIPDRLAGKPFYLAGAPAHWSDGGLLTDSGKRAAESHAHIMMMAFGGHELNGELAGLLAFHGEQPPTPENHSGTVMRTLQYIAVCEHTDKAPDYFVGQWP